MQERSVEVAVGFADHTWRDIWVKVPKDPSHVLEDDEVEEKAIELAKLVFSSVEVSFFSVIYIEPLDYVAGVV